MYPGLLIHNAVFKMHGALGSAIMCTNVPELCTIFQVFIKHVPQHCGVHCKLCAQIKCLISNTTMQCKCKCKPGHLFSGSFIFEYLPFSHIVLFLMALSGPA